MLPGSERNRVSGAITTRWDNRWGPTWVGVNGLDIVIFVSELEGQRPVVAKNLRPTGRLMPRHTLTATARWSTGSMSSGSGRWV
jgi:hypothetical protein